MQQPSLRDDLLRSSLLADEFIATYEDGSRSDRAKELAPGWPLAMRVHAEHAGKSAEDVRD